MRVFNTTLIPTLMILAGIPLPADEVTKWNELANQLALQSGLANQHPLFQTRMLAMAQAAVHDAINAIDRRYRCYSACPSVTGAASAEAAVATAAFTVLGDQFSQIAAFGFPPQQADLNTAYAMSLAAIPAGPAKALGIQVGPTAASQILSLRAGDGVYLLLVVDPDYRQGTRPGEYRYSAPSAQSAVCP